MDSNSGETLKLSWRNLFSPWLPVALGPLILLGPALIRGEVMFWGTPLLQFMPWRAYGFELLAQGQLPVWNPHLGMGAPLLANYQAAFLYPFNGLLMLVNLVWGHGLLVLVHLILAGWGMAALSGRLGFGRLASTLAGMSFGMSGYLVARAGFFSINATAAWLPWILWALEGWLEAQGWKSSDFLPLVGFLWLQWLAGHAQTAWYTLLLVLVWLIWRILQPPRRISVRRLIRLGAPFGLAFILAAPQLLPTMEYLLHSQRSAAVDPAIALTYSFWPWRLLELLAPGVFGHPAYGDFWGYANYWEDALYFGVLPFLLSIAGIILSLRRRGENWRLGRFLAAISAVSFLLALGHNTAVFPWLMRNVPTFNLFQAPTRWNLLVAFTLPLLAAIGVEHWKPAEGRSLYWLRLSTAGAAAVSGGALLASWLLPDVRDTFLLAFGLAGLWLFLAGVLALMLQQGRPDWWQRTVVLIVMTDLIIATNGLVPTTSPTLYHGVSDLAERLEDGRRAYMSPEIEYEYTFFQSFRFDTFSALRDWRQVRDVGLPNTLLLDGKSSANNFDPLVPARYQAWMDWLAGLPDSLQESYLALMNVQLASRSANEQGMPRYAAIDNPRRIRWFSTAEFVADGEVALERLSDDAFNP
ncbi:MAG: YfhO family protein, partial [Anaerolineales bacterium]